MHARLTADYTGTCRSQAFNLGLAKVRQALHYLEFHREGIHTETITPRTEGLQAAAPPRGKMQVLHGGPSGADNEPEVVDLPLRGAGEPRGLCALANDEVLPMRC